MADIVMVGAGVVGLGTALLLARDGHQVTVLERDPHPPPDSALDTWTGWPRRGVSQFRLPHFFLARYRAIVEDELPEVAEAIEAAGGLRYNPVLALPEAVRGAERPTDHELEVLTGRRPVVESVLTAAAVKQPGLILRRGVAVSGVLTGRPTRCGIPHVNGVRTVTGEEIRAELVVDMAGRRSPLCRWLVDAGVRPPAEEIDDGGFRYYSRHYRSPQAAIPAAFGPPLQPLGTISSVTLPADNGTWSVVLVTAAHDRALSGLRDTARWERTVRSLPRVAHWIDGEPIDPQVVTLTKIEDRIRHYLTDGQPVATGVVSVGDAWACTGPHHGRGMSIGMLHGLTLRQALRDIAVSDPYGFSLSFHHATTENVGPLFAWTRSQSRHRLADIDARLRGGEYRPADQRWDLVQSLACAATRDNDCLRAFARANLLVQPPELALAADHNLLHRVRDLGGDWRSQPIPAPTRDQLVALSND
jgi:2-polyprenyl-6-methoxyphenol hydroxylase-like FAD-dependent oxidoreductase